MRTREELELKVKNLEEIGKKDASPEIQNAVAKAKTALQSFDAAIKQNQTAEAERLVQEIVGLDESASALIANRGQSLPKTKLEKFWPWLGGAVLAVVFGGLGWFIVHYASRLGLSTLTTIEGTRPLLVIAAIISTIAFGGALIIGSLFSAEEAGFENRFRHAREIFLVFSGIFGTVIGFYFGASDTKGTQLSVSATRQDSTIVAYATDGTPPYKITLIYSPEQSKTEETKTGWARFTFDEQDDVNQFKISVIDSKMLQGSASIETNENKPDADQKPQSKAGDAANKPALPSGQ